MKYKIILSLIICLLIFPVVNSFVLEVNEGELVKLNIESVDADEDPITFFFSEPLDENGEWQTDFYDAGNYTIYVTADDGQEQVTQEVTLIVRNVNQAPEIFVEDIEVDEGETAKIEPEIEDIDNDQITITYPSPFNIDGEWDTSFDDAGEYEIIISAFDGALTTEETVNVVVNDINQLPNVNIKPGAYVQINETDIIMFEIDADDFDGDELAYAWYKEGQLISESPEFNFVSDFNSSGSYSFLAVVYDKETKVEVPVEVSVANVNRIPIFNISEVIIIKETDTINLNLPSTDADGQSISYYISDPIGDDQVWKTTYDDAGEYEIEITADDSEGNFTDKITLVVQDVDRAPEVSDIETEAYEGEELSIELTAEDPDGDEILYEIIKGPEDMVIEGNTLLWTPSYDFIDSQPGAFKKLLFNYNLAKEIDYSKTY